MSISIVIPVYLNETTLKPLYEELKNTFLHLGHPYEIIFVNDASPDGSEEVLQEIAGKDSSVQVLSLETNHGQHAAVLKGFEICQGEIVLVMDADLQDPPDFIPLLLEKKGYDVIFAGRHGNYESFVRLFTSKVFKWLMHKICHIPKDAGMFFAISKQAAKKIRHIEMVPPFIPALIGLADLTSSSIPFERVARKDGKSAYTSKMRLKIGLNAARESLRIKRQLRQLREQKKYYGNAVHKNIIPNNYPHSIQKHLKELFSYLHLEENARVLEVGCGMGRFTIPLAEKKVRIEGMDLSEVLLEKLKSSSTIPVHCGDVLHPPEELKGQFDVVVGFFILHHLPEMNKAFQAIFSLLKPTGKILFIEPNPYNPLYYAQIFFHPKMRWKNERHMLSMRKNHIFSSMNHAGLTNFMMKRYGFFPPFLAHKKGFSSLESVLEKTSTLKSILPYQVFYAEKTFGVF
jgi:glycosyltransferase involved in cell wall biosynthesis